MANLKVVLRKEKRADGTYPLAIRITQNRKSSYLYLNYSVPQADWDEKAQRVKKSNANSVWLNNFLIRKINEATDTALEVESSKKAFSVQAVRKSMLPKTSASVFAQADLYIQRLKDDGKFNRYSADKPRVERLKKYLKPGTPFCDITVALLERYKAYLISNYGVSERTAVNHLVVVRSIFSQAIAEGVCEEKYYPFGKNKIQIKFPESTKIGLGREEVAAIESAKLTEKADHARNIWLLSFYFAGMRISDLLRLKWSDFRGGRLYYSMGKNKKAGSLKVPDKANVILEKYKAKRDPTSNLVFPELRNVKPADPYNVQRAIASRNNALDTLLKTEVAPAAAILSPLTMHIARHTFGNISGDKIPIQMLQKLYRHSSVTTTIGYQSNFIHKDADDALAAVLG